MIIKYKKVLFLSALLMVSGCENGNTTIGNPLGSDNKNGNADTTPPVLTLKGPSLLNLTVGNTYEESGATAIDDVDGDISTKIIVGGDTVNTSTAGTYAVAYDVSDNAGNEAVTLTRDVVVNLAGTPPKTGGKPWEHGKLEVDGRMLKHADNTGFFWMGDTAWMLARNYILPKADIPAPLSKEDVDMYLQDRADKGFNVIQMSAVQDGDWLTSSTVHYAPFEEGKYKKLKSEYWDKVDYIVQKAEQLGLYIALLPAWDMDINSHGLVNTEKARSYGTAIANRYKNSPNIIWVIGGDSPQKPSSDAWKKKRQVWHTLGQTIQSVVGQTQLITYHPGTGINWLLETTTPIVVNGKNEGNFGDSWLDFFMIQSGHGASMQDANKRLSDLYASGLDKPMLDGEPRYEEIHKGFDNSYPAYGAKDVREIAYRQLFSGAFGHTYGNNAIWQFWKKGNSSCCSTPANSWDVALNDDGAKQMKFVAKLMRSRPILNRVPNQSLISNGNGIATKGNGYAMVYLPKGGSITVGLDKIASSVKAWWFNPKNGVATPIDTYQTSSQVFTTGSDDMVLVLDDVSRGFTTPGE